MYPLVLGFLIKGVIIDCIGVFLRGRKASLTPAIFIVFLQEHLYKSKSQFFEKI